MMLLKLLTFAFFWVLSVGWHLGCIMRGRPAYANLSDSRLTVASFVGVFYVAGLLRHVVADPTPLTVSQGLFVLTAYLVVVLLVFERQDRSSGLVAALLGSSAAADLLIFGTWIFDGPSTHWTLQAYEVIIFVLALLHFGRQPAEVQRRGYKRPAGQ